LRSRASITTIKAPPILARTDKRIDRAEFRLNFGTTEKSGSLSRSEKIEGGGSESGRSVRGEAGGNVFVPIEMIFGA
jgi:hypothetical protein